MYCLSPSPLQEMAKRARKDPFIHSSQPTIRTAIESIWAGKQLERHAEDIRQPVLIMHGTADRRIYISSSYRLFNNIGSSIEDKVHILRCISITRFYSNA